MRKIAVILALVSITACATVGKNIADEQLSEFKPGISTEVDVVEKLGKPSSRTRLGDGSVMISYSFVTMQFGAYNGRIVSVRFSPDGKMVDTTVSETNAGGGAGRKGSE